MGTLDGKVAVVTGAGQGLGRCHAMTLAEQGAAVIVNDVNVANAQSVVDEITAAGGRAAANNTSVTDWDGSKAMMDQAIETFGDFTTLVNNAGITRDKMSFSMEESDWDAVIEVHLKGHVCLAHHAAKWWRDQSKDGVTTPRRIINTTSEAALFGSAGQSNYASAKGGIVTLTWVLARELEKYGVTVNVVAPRARTAMTESMSFMAAPTDGRFDRYNPIHASKVVAWLAGDSASDVNGQVFIAVGADVHLVKPFDIVSTVTRDGGWTVETLTAAKDELFGDRPKGPPMTGVAR